jgi:hypothetical protein
MSAMIAIQTVVQVKILTGHAAKLAANPIASASKANAYL